MTDKGLYSLSESPSKEPSDYKEYKVADLPEVVGNIPLVPGQDTAPKADVSHKIERDYKASKGLDKYFGKYMK
jgi:hypothetical protein